QDLVAAFGGQGHHRRTAARGPVTADVVQAVEGQVAAAHYPGVDLGIFGQGDAAADGPAVELEDPVECEAPGPALGVLGVNRMAIAGTQFLDGQLLDPCFVHSSPPLLKSMCGPAPPSGRPPDRRFTSCPSASPGTRSATICRRA